MRSFQLEKLNPLRSSSAIADIESVSPTLDRFDRRIGISLAAAIADREGQQPAVKPVGYDGGLKKPKS
ncbi:hypothetical protein CKA32_000992 [Geitlerinema sp. FC II]|nr:hypothetical protein CKA32_000992 [Geitlerinema sp. FC II]